MRHSWQLATTIRSLCADTLRTVASPSLSVELPRLCQLLHCGFITQLGGAPRWRVPLRIGTEPRLTLLFQGPPPRTLWADGRSLPLRLAERPIAMQVFFKPQLCAELLRMMQTFVGSLRVAAARRQDVSWALGPTPTPLQTRRARPAGWRRSNPEVGNRKLRLDLSRVRSALALGGRRCSGGEGLHLPTSAMLNDVEDVSSSGGRTRRARPGRSRPDQDLGEKHGARA